MTIQNLGTTALTTTGTPVWDPGSARSLLLHCACLGQPGAVSAGLLVHLCDGTATGAGTIACITVPSDEAGAQPYGLGEGVQLTKGNPLCIKVPAGVGTVAGYFVGDYILG